MSSFQEESSLKKTIYQKVVQKTQLICKNCIFQTNNHYIFIKQTNGELMATSFSKLLILFQGIHLWVPITPASLTVTIVSGIPLINISYIYINGTRNSLINIHYICACYFKLLRNILYSFLVMLIICFLFLLN